MIPDIGTQLMESLAPRIDRLNTTAAPVVAEDIKGKMLVQSNESRGFGNDQFKPTYSPRYVKRREKIGIKPPEKVTLRFKDRAIETAFVSVNREGAEIAFQDKGDIFLYHHEGMGRNPVRSIFPKSNASVPNDTNDLAFSAAKAVLNGR